MPFKLERFVAPNHKWNFNHASWSFAQDINDNRQIVGWMKRQGNPTSTGFIMSPVTWTASLEMVGGSPGVAGGNNTVRATGFDPGAQVYFIYSRFGGGTMIPGCALLDNAVQLDDPQIVGVATADGAGLAEYTGFVPAAAANLGEILIQAVAPSSCAISNYIVVEFQ